MSFPSLSDLRDPRRISSQSDGVGVQSQSYSYPARNTSLSGAADSGFSQDAPSLERAKLQAYDTEIKIRGIEVGKRCRVGGEDEKRGEVMYVGEVEQIPDSAGKWIGIKLDEPVGKNDGSLGGKRYWGKDGDPKHGVFVRPERVEVGDWPVLDDLEDIEEI
jgi:tubulin-folding cofactor B